MKRLVVILGSEESGASILTEFLIQLGVKTNIDADGTDVPFFEDCEMTAIQDRFFSELSLSPSHRVPRHFYVSDAAEKCKKDMHDLLNVRFNDLNNQFCASIRSVSTSLLPLWYQVFDESDVDPIYFLSVRDPSSLLTLRGSKNSDEKLSNEIEWLRYIGDVLSRTNGDCVLIRYEDWFNGNASNAALSIADLLGLNTTKALSASKYIFDMHKDSCIVYPVSIANEKIKNIYSELGKIGYSNNGKKTLVKLIKQANTALIGDANLQELASGTVGSVINSEIVTDIGAKSFENSLTAIDENNRLLHQIRNLEEENRHYKILLEANPSLLPQNTTGNSKAKLNVRENMISQGEISKLLSRQEKQYLKVVNSVSYRLGVIFVDAFSKPGENTLFMPYRLIRLILSETVVKKWA